MLNTLISSALIQRRDSKETISANDVENYAVEAVWKIFDRSRRNLSEKLEIGGHELSVKEAKVIGFKIDGRRVLNPEGFNGRSIEVVAEVTLNSRSERGVDELPLQIHSKSEEMSWNNLIHIETGSESSRIYLKKSTETKNVGEFAWSKGNFINSLGWIFGSEDKEVNELLYERFISHKCSNRLLEKMRQRFNESFATIVEEIKHLVGVHRLSSYSISMNSFELPAEFWNKQFKIGDRTARILPLSLGPVATNPIYDSINASLQKRIKWFVQNGV